MSLARLKEPFPANDIEWRVQTAGEKNGQVWARVLAYVTNRAIQNRLDEVVGPENWRNEFAPGPAGGVMCGISIRVDGEWVTKWDGAENTDIEEVKGGLSNAMKRAAVQWGIGRYLYDLEEGFARVHEKGRHFAKTKDNKPFKWDPPELPGWALPSDQRGSGPQPASVHSRDLLTRVVAEFATPDFTLDPKESKAVKKAAMLVDDGDATEEQVQSAIRYLSDLLDRKRPFKEGAIDLPFNDAA